MTYLEFIKAFHVKSFGLHGDSNLQPSSCQVDVLPLFLIYQILFKNLEKIEKSIQKLKKQLYFQDIYGVCELILYNSSSQQI